MNPVHKHLSFILPLSLLSFSCAEEDIPATDRTRLDDFYVHLTSNSTEYALETKYYQVKPGIEKSGCTDNYTYGVRYTDVVATEEEANFITRLSLGITKKVAITDLGAPQEVAPGVYKSYSADSIAYTREVLTHGNVGYAKVGFPISADGYSLPIKGGEPTLAEAYLRIDTQGGKSYLSTSNEAAIRVDTSYFRITNILNLGDLASEGYSYIVEGEFNVNVFYEGTQNDSKVIAGRFRLPVYTYRTADVLERCK